jgi:hydrogenase expression/formation protein HypC
MCVGVPLRIVEAGDFVARGEGRNGIEDVNMMLIGTQPVGTWVLNFLGSAREVISEHDAAQINSALDGLAAIMNGEETIDVDHYFPGIANP